jgi:hypothetical protein
MFGGLVKSIFGGGNSSQSQVNKQNTVIENDVEVNIDIDKLADVIEETSSRDLYFRSQVVTKELSNKAKEQKIKENSLKLNALSLQEQMKNNKRVTTLTIIGIALAFIGLLFQKRKRGKA